MKTYDEIDNLYGQDARADCDVVARYTGTEFPALDGTIQTTEVLLFICGFDDDGWIITTADLYDDGETTTDGGTDQAGRTVYATANDARAAALSAIVAR